MLDFMMLVQEGMTIEKWCCSSRRGLPTVCIPNHEPEQDCTRASEVRLSALAVLVFHVSAFLRVLFGDAPTIVAGEMLLFCFVV